MGVAGGEDVGGVTGVGNSHVDKDGDRLSVTSLRISLMRKEDFRFVMMTSQSIG